MNIKKKKLKKKRDNTWAIWRGNRRGVWKWKQERKMKARENFDEAFVVVPI
jgi:hypothetical protein